MLNTVQQRQQQQWQRQQQQLTASISSIALQPLSERPKPAYWLMMRPHVSLPLAFPSIPPITVPYQKLTLKVKRLIDSHPQGPLRPQRPNHLPPSVPKTSTQ